MNYFAASWAGPEATVCMWDECVCVCVCVLCTGSMVWMPGSQPGSKCIALSNISHQTGPRPCWCQRTLSLYLCRLSPLSTAEECGWRELAYYGRSAGTDTQPAWDCTADCQSKASVWMGPTIRVMKADFHVGETWTERSATAHLYPEWLCQGCERHVRIKKI